MTTRNRRNTMQQAEDALNKLLVKQEAKAAERYAVFRAAQDQVDATRKALAALQSPTGPGPKAPPPPVESFAASEGLRLDIAEVVNDTRLHRQRIGEKKDVDDVWPAPELGPVNHSALMYSRMKACDLCYKGTPYATTARTEHYLAEKDSRGEIIAFGRVPCKGAA